MLFGMSTSELKTHSPPRNERTTGINRIWPPLAINRHVTLSQQIPEKSATASQCRPRARKEGKG